MLLGQPIRQIAYYVEDIRAAAERHHRMFGSGPYYLLENTSMTVDYRGQDTEFSTSQALGQWGALQIEFLQSNNDGPSVLHDLYPAGSGKYGLHHVSMIVDDLDAAVRDGDAEGYPVAMWLYYDKMDMKIAFLDAVDTYGHFIELYQEAPGIVGFYDMVEKGAQDFDGTDLFREVSL